MSSLARITCITIPTSTVSSSNASIRTQKPARGNAIAASPLTRVERAPAAGGGGTSDAPVAASLALAPLAAAAAATAGSACNTEDICGAALPGGGDEPPGVA